MLHDLISRLIVNLESERDKINERIRRLDKTLFRLAEVDSYELTDEELDMIAGGEKS